MSNNKYSILVRIALRALCLGYYTHIKKRDIVKNAYSEYMIWMKPQPMTTPILNI